MPTKVASSKTPTRIEWDKLGIAKRPTPSPNFVEIRQSSGPPSKAVELAESLMVGGYLVLPVTYKDGKMPEDVAAAIRHIGRALSRGKDDVHYKLVKKGDKAINPTKIELSAVKMTDAEYKKLHPEHVKTVAA
jgi:hypothetical protein